MEVAIDEFSKNSFKIASITKIAEAAGIAKGSIYQYFNDKKDLYRHVIEIASQKKVEYLVDFMYKMEELEFIELIRELYIKGIQFARGNPKLAAIGSNFLKESDVKFKEEILGKGMEKSNEIFEMLIEKAKLKGEIDPEIDTKIGAYVISTLNVSISDYVLSYMKYEDVLEDDNYAVKNVSFNIEKGELFGFLGPSGAGKSTTQNILLGLLKLQKGEVIIDSKDFRHASRDLFNHIGVSFERGILPFR